MHLISSYLYSLSFFHTLSHLDTACFVDLPGFQAFVNGRIEIADLEELADFHVQVVALTEGVVDRSTREKLVDLVTELSRDLWDDNKDHYFDYFWRESQSMCKSIFERKRPRILCMIQIVIISRTFIPLFFLFCRYVRHVGAVWKCSGPPDSF